MAIAIPLIGGVREAANNSKCRSNLKQLHTAVIAYATGNKERLPDLSIGNLQSLINGGYIESESKLGICPGAGAKPKLPISSYAGGPDLDGTKKLSSAGINSNTIILEDAETTYHKAGKNVIRMDGSFRQDGLAPTPLVDQHAWINSIVNANLWARFYLPGVEHYEGGNQAAYDFDPSYPDEPFTEVGPPSIFRSVQDFKDSNPSVPHLAYFSGTEDLYRWDEASQQWIKQRYKNGAPGNREDTDMFLIP